MRHLSTVCISVLLLFSCSRNAQYYTISGYAQGGSYCVKASLSPGTDPMAVKRGIDSILEGIDFSVSGYNGNSLLSRFNAGESIKPDRTFRELYSISRKLWEESQGALDVSAAPLFDIWGFGFTADSLPPERMITEALASSGMQRLKDSIGTGNSGALLVRDDGFAPPKLNFNAIAQGYSCDVIAGYLQDMGVENMLIDVGGEIFCKGKNPSGAAWSIGIDRPVDGNFTPGADMQGVFKVPEGPHGVVTSGNYRKYYVRDGRKYSHTIDPGTGMPVSHNLLSATIIAGDAVSADGFATACMVIGLEKAKEFILSREELEGCLIYDSEGTIRSWTSPGLRLDE